MRKIITTCLMLAIIVNTFSQQTDVTAPALTKTDYLKKSKNQKTTAWILAGGGFALTTIGATMLAADGVEEIAGIFDAEASDGGGDAGMAVMITGLAAIGGSIPLFIAAGRNKRMAMSLTLKNEKVQQIVGSGISYRSMPSISLKFNL